MRRDYAPMPIGEPTYCADPAERVRAVELEGLTLLYHRPSGMTHLLAPPAPQILELLGEAGLTSRDLEARMSERFELAGSTDALLARLDELVAAGLVERR